MTSPTSTSTPDAAPASVPPTAEAPTPPTPPTPEVSAAATSDAAVPASAPASTPATAQTPPATTRPARTRAHVRRLRTEQGDPAREGGVGSALRAVARAGRRAFDRARSALASLVWTAALVAAGVLLLGVVLVAADANTHNALVQWVLKAADVLDLGVFGRDTGVKHFTGEGAAVKNAVVNWGLAAVAWLAVGRVVRRLLTLGAH